MTEWIERLKQENQRLQQQEQKKQLNFIEQNKRNAQINLEKSMQLKQISKHERDEEIHKFSPKGLKTSGGQEQRSQSISAGMS